MGVPAHGDELFNGKRGRGRAELGNDRHLRRIRLVGDLRDVVSNVADHPFPGFEDLADSLEKGGLAGAVRPDDPEDAPLGNPEGDVVNDGLLPVSCRDVFDGEDVHVTPPLPAGP